ncbi:MAG: hypothetical protein U1F29_18040 [Planctomycetota bacterium]
MKKECALFRAELERRLSDARDAGFTELGWHEHLLGCASCRALLEAEEALDVLLASLPEPRLPRRLADRLLVRLREASRREEELDQLLALDEHAAPEGLASRIAAGVRVREARNERALDALLDRVPAPVAPTELGERVVERLTERHAAEERALDRLLDRDAIIGAPTQLGERVLARLAPVRNERHAESRAPLPSVSAWRTRRVWVWAAAAGLVATLATWLAWPRSRPFVEPAPIVRDEPTHPRTSDPRDQRPEDHGARDTVRENVGAVDAPGEDVLAALDVLEQWDLLMHDDVDVLLSTIAPADESLLEVDDAVPAEDAPAETETKPEGKKG